MLTQLQGFDEVMGFGKGYVIWMFSLFLVRSCHFSWMSCFQTVVLQVKIFFQFVYIMFCNPKITSQKTSDGHPSNPWSKKTLEVWKTGPDKLRSWFQISTECLGGNFVEGPLREIISWKLRSSHGVSNFFGNIFFLVKKSVIQVMWRPFRPILFGGRKKNLTTQWFANATLKSCETRISLGSPNLKGKWDSTKNHSQEDNLPKLPFDDLQWGFWTVKSPQHE